MDGSSTPNKVHYVPSNPSQLREAHSPPQSPQFPSSTHQLAHHDTTDYGFPRSSTTNTGNGIQGGSGHKISKAERQRRMSYKEWDMIQHGLVSPSISTPADYSDVSTPMSEDVLGGPYRDNPASEPESIDGVHRYFGDAIADGLLKKKKSRSTTKWLAHTQGVKDNFFMYFKYYIPFMQWVPQYKLSFLVGDLISALTMASFYIPMSLSLASNLAHVPAINGLYSFAINPLIYAVLGTCPQMVVGPEAAGSLLTGNVVRDSINKGHSREDNGLRQAEVAGVVTGTAGLILLLAGGARLGFLDNVLSKPFLRGFISAVGITILVDQLVPEMGLSSLAAGSGSAHGSSVDKIVFLAQNIRQSHALTCAVSFGALAIIFIFREIKKRLQPRYPHVAYLPDRFLVVVVATILCWQLRWDQQGLTVLGDARSASGRPFPAQNPFHFSRLKHLDTALSTAFVIALLGFFESSVAAKGLGTGPSDGIQHMQLSANRELIALGAANIIGGVFSAIPAFGGYGRSKVNSATGGKTPMSSVFLSLITFFCIYVLLPWFYYIPKGVLSAMISIVAYSLIEEAPHDLKFFWRVGGWNELFLILLVFFTTIFYSLSLGIACGIGFSLMRVIQHATRPRIQILGRVKGTDDQFENAEADPDHAEFIKGCLIVKIPEPLTFANTGELKGRLDKLMNYGTVLAHPALPRVRQEENNKNVIFDIHGVTSLDCAGAQVLYEILESYKHRGIRVFFCRVPSPRSQVYKLLDRSGILGLCGGPSHFVRSVREALRLAELEDVIEQYTDE